MTIHSNQIIVGEDLSIRWSATGSISTFISLGVISSYSLVLQCQTKDIIPCSQNFEETVKIGLKGTLGLTVLTDKSFEMPDPFVWIEIGLLIKGLDNGDTWQWNRTAKYLITSDAVSQKPDDMVQHQYTLSSQSAIVSERVLVPNTVVTYWQAPSTADLQFSFDVGSTNFINFF
jgi:hypothetical protein